MPDDKSVEYVAKLARIEISKEQKDSLGEQLSKIIDYIDKLKELDVEGVMPLRDVHMCEDIFREDEAKDSCMQKDILENSPSSWEGYFKIPKVIE